MSLINDALKKAERQRASAAPAPTAPGNAGPGVQSSPKSATTTILLVAGGALLGLGLAVGTILLWPDSSSPAPTATVANLAGASVRQTASALPAKPTGPAVVTPAPLPPTQPPASSPPQHQPAQSPAPAPVDARPAAILQQATPSVIEPVAKSAELPKVPAPTIESPPPPATLTGPSPIFVKRVEAFRVAGIRHAGADSRVILNDRVYRLGETVDLELGIKLVEVSPKALTFIDASGSTYTRHF